MSDPLRDQLARILAWEEAHVGFDKVVDGIPAASRGVVPPGFEHSAWQLLEHLRIAQADLLDFCVNPSYVHTRTWPDDYWPDLAPSDAAAWDEAIAAFRRDRQALTAVCMNASDLFAPVPTGNAQQTVLRAILLVADHNAYHLGQLVLLRRALGLWH